LVTGFRISFSGEEVLLEEVFVSAVRRCANGIMSWDGEYVNIELEEMENSTYTHRRWEALIVSIP